jgi:hypothetical protein
MNTNDMLKYLYNGDALLLLGGVVFIIALALLARFVSSLFTTFDRKPTFYRRPRVSLGSRVLHLLLILVFAFLSLSLVFAGTTCRAYTVFTREDLVARLECLEWNPAKKLIVVRLQTLRDNSPVSTQTYDLYGDQWEVSAHILKWNAAVNLLGMHTAYRLNMIKGIYQQPQDENSQPHQAYALSQFPDWIWRFLSRYGERLPFIQAVYGNAVSNAVQTGETFDIFVTTSGLSTRRK